MYLFKISSKLLLSDVIQVSVAAIVMSIAATLYPHGVLHVRFPPETLRYE